MTLFVQTKHAVVSALKHLFPDAEINASMVSINLTKPEFTGDYTVVLFPFVKALRMKPDVLGAQLGDYLVKNGDLFTTYQIVSGFLNLSVKDAAWAQFLQNHFNDVAYGELVKSDERVMVEYSSPNTNKPLHFGHMRNIFLGASVSKILAAYGKEVIKANLINDRGVHICKSMLMWQKDPNPQVPGPGKKGDHLVGDYYVMFNNELKKEVAPAMKTVLSGVVPDSYSPKAAAKLDTQLKELKALEAALANEGGKLAPNLAVAIGYNIPDLIQNATNGYINWKDVIKKLDTAEADEKTAEKAKNDLKKLLKNPIAIEEKIDKKKDEIKELVTNNTPLMLETQEMLRKWEAGDTEVRELWKKMNGWVYDGFDVTYKKMGISFDKWYYESDTYLLGKQMVADGLQKGVLFKKEDGSVWIDLKDEGLDEKLLQRGDGTSVYITQDMGTAKLKYDDYKLDKSVYVIGDEQNYHMQVLKLILKKLGEPCADAVHHLSYGMVELPTGRMKSREGTVVDADDMVAEMVRLSREQAEENGKTEGFTEEELAKLYDMVGLGALKFYLLRVDPKKKMIFDPKESIDLHGFTATFIQYAHTRICSILRKEEVPLMPDTSLFQAFKLTQDITPAEKKMILQLEQYPNILATAATEYNPSELCNYTFQLAQAFNSFYDVHSISKAENEEKKQLRLMIVVMTASVMRHAMGLLGIQLPERM